MPPAASPAIESILATLDLATKFAFLIVVGPDDHPELARWSLAVHLQAMGQEVLWHSLADADLDLPALLERAQSPNPVVIASGIEALSPEHRHARFARMNLERDVWGQYPVRVVLWCSTEHIDRLQHLAPDLFHWRSLIQPLTAPDLCVFDRTTYLAWLADDCAERSDDRVLRGGNVLLRDPLVFSKTATDAASTIVNFSDWVLEQRRALLTREQTRDPRYPAKDLVRSYALRRLDGREAPFPVLLNASKLHSLASMTLSFCPVTSIREGWNIITPDDADVILFLVNDYALPWELSTLTDDYPRATWIFIADSNDLWREGVPGWDHSFVITNNDPLSVGGSVGSATKALATLLNELFTLPILARFLRSTQGQNFSERISEVECGSDDHASTAVNLLLAEERISTALFDALRALRPRRWQDINRVEQMFIDLAEQDEAD